MLPSYNARPMITPSIAHSVNSTPSSIDAAAPGAAAGLVYRAACFRDIRCSEAVAARGPFLRPLQDAALIPRPLARNQPCPHLTGLVPGQVLRRVAHHLALRGRPAANINPG